MSRRFAVVYTVLFATALFCVFALAGELRGQHDEEGAKPGPRPPCLEFVAGPSPLFACSDKHAWQWQGRWVDAGLLTPVPEVGRPEDAR